MQSRLWYLLAAIVALWPLQARSATQFEDITCATTATAGTGTVTLGASPDGYLPFSTTITSGNTVPYHIVSGDGTSLETGFGVYTSGAETLTRVAEWSTDGSGSELSLSGTSTVCVGPIAGLLQLGAGSTIDADLLDGISSAAFALDADIGTTIQAWDADLDSWRAVVRASGFDTFTATPSMANLGSLLTDDASGWTTFGTTPSSANLRSLLTDEIDNGVLVFLGTPADDQVPVGASASDTTWTTVPDSDGATQKLQYDQATNAFSAGTDDDVPESGDFGGLTGGTGITNSAGTLSFDATELTDLTFGAGGTATIAWTFNLSGTDPVLTAGSGTFAVTGTLTPEADNTRVLGTTGLTWSELHATLWEVGNATDTTIARSGAGTLTVESIGIVRGATGGTDNSILRADGTGGTLLQNSVLVIADTSGAISGAASGFSIEFFGASGTDSTLTAPSAGDLNIEGNRIYRAGGTDVALSDGGTGASLVDPNADRFIVWDDSAGAVVFADVGSGLDFSATPTLDLDFTELNTFTLGAGAATGIIFDAGATDPAIETGSGTFTVDIGGTDELALTATTLTVGGAITATAADITAGDDLVATDDIQLSAGGLIDMGGGDVVITFAANDLDFTGVTGDYSFDDTVLVTGTVDASDDLDAGDDVLIADDINFGGGDVLISYSANDLAFSGVTGDYSFDDTVGVTGSLTATVDVVAGFTDAAPGGGDLAIDSDGDFYFYEAEVNGDNSIAFLGVASISADRTCQLVDGAAPIPDSCVGNGTDDTGAGSLPADPDGNYFLWWDDTAGSSKWTTDMATASVVNVDDGAAGPAITFQHDSASSADGDIPLALNVKAGADDEQVGSIRMELDDGATGSEDTQWQFVVRSAGSDLTALTLGDTTVGGHLFQTNGAFEALVHQSNNDGGAGGIIVYNNSATPADNDEIGWFVLQGEDDAGNRQTYGNISVRSLDVTNATEDGDMRLQVMAAGSLTTALTLAGEDGGGFSLTTFDTDYYVYNIDTANNFGVYYQGNDGGNLGPFLSMRHNSPTPAADDIVAEITLDGKDSGGNTANYGVIDGVIVDATNGSEDGKMVFTVPSAGSALTALTLNGSTDVSTFNTQVLINDSSTAALTVDGSNAFWSMGNDTGSKRIYQYFEKSSVETGTVWTQEGWLWNGVSGLEVGSIELAVTDATGSSEDSTLAFDIVSAGSIVTALTLDGSVPNMQVGTGMHIELPEISDPSAPAANKGRLYIRDNGSSKSQLVVRFPSGAVQVIVTEP